MDSITVANSRFLEDAYVFGEIFIVIYRFSGSVRAICSTERLSLRCSGLLDQRALGERLDLRLID